VSDWPDHIIDLPPERKAELMLADSRRYFAQCWDEEYERAKEWVVAELDRRIEKRRTERRAARRNTWWYRLAHKIGVAS
jgi:hypothetical protein